MPPIKRTKRLIAGLIFLYLSGLGYIAEILAAFMPINHKAEILVTILVITEASFFIAIALIGKSTYKALKLWLLHYIRNRPKP